jgi:hypothetical protein
MQRVLGQQLRSTLVVSRLMERTMALSSMRLPGMGVTAEWIMTRMMIGLGIAQSGLKDSINRLVAERTQWARSSATLGVFQLGTGWTQPVRRASEN